MESKDQFTDPVTDKNIVDLNIRNALGLGVVHHGLPGGKQPPRVRVALGIADVHDNIVYDLVGCIETKRGRIANIQIDYLIALAFQFHCFLVYRSPNIVFEMIEALTLLKFHRKE